ncbi:MAG: hypothetical protein RR877_09845 [Aurantimicrobium sp.]|uniref:hypothetical protein n=1 Tax=Aurantimicrobium sp. TaxID=1930784 RepID=UPI002FC7D9E8
MREYETPKLPKGFFFRVSQPTDIRGKAYDWYWVQLRRKPPWWMWWLGSDMVTKLSACRTKESIHLTMRELAAMVAKEVNLSPLVGDYPPKKL